MSNSNYPHPILAREGWPFIAITLVVVLVINTSAGFGWALPFWILFAFVVQFFRDPPRPIPQGPRMSWRRPTAASWRSSRCATPTSTATA